MRLRVRLPDLWYPRFWAGWAAASALSFALVETSALTVQPRCARDTLTQNLQHWFCRRPVAYWSTVLAWCGFSVWFLDHIWLSHRRRELGL